MIWWRLRSIDDKTDCWVRLIATSEVYSIADQLGARISPLINVIRFNCAEDITVFRLRAGI